MLMILWLYTTMHVLHILDMINKYMKLKEISVGDPDLYLGAKLSQMKMPNWIVDWGSISPSKYLYARSS